LTRLPDPGPPAAVEVVAVEPAPPVVELVAVEPAPPVVELAAIWTERDGWTAVAGVV